MIPVRKFEIRICSEKLHIVYKNHLNSPKERFTNIYESKNLANYDILFNNKLIS